MLALSDVEALLPVLSLPLAIIVAIHLASSSALKTWVAVSSLDAPNTSNDDDDAKQALKRRLRRRRIFGALSLALFLTVVMMFDTR